MHFAPQSDKQIAEHGAIGNLLWIPEVLNLDLGAKSVNEKRKILRKASGLWVPNELLTSSTWDDDAIVSRSADLGELGYEKIWSLS